MDDLILSSRTPDATWTELGKLLDLTPAEPLQKILGVNVSFKKGSDKAGGFFDAAFSMPDYSKLLVERYKQVKGALPLSPRVTSPYLQVSPSEYTSSKETDALTVFQQHAASIIMGVMYLARMCRSDILNTTTELTTHLTKWSRVSDKKLQTLLSYLNNTADYAMWGRVRCRQAQGFRLEHFADANLGGLDLCTRSVSGGLSFVVDDLDTRFPVFFSSRRQTATATSTAESELVALTKLVLESVLPLEETLEFLFQKEIPSTTWEDNMACTLVVRSGFSQALRHLQKHHRLAIGTAHETYSADHRELKHIATERQRADGLTKGMAPCKIPSIRSQLGIFPITTGLDSTFLSKTVGSNQTAADAEWPANWDRYADELKAQTAK